jgi:hypothetical protein
VIRPRAAPPPPIAHQAIEADGVGADRRIALVRDRLTADEGERLQRRDGLDEAVGGEHRGEWLTKRFARLGKEEQWDRLWRQQGSMDDERLRGGACRLP